MELIKAQIRKISTKEGADRIRHRHGYQDASLGVSPISSNRAYSRGYMLGLRDARDLRTGVFQAY